MRRAAIVVLDGVGIGAAPDAAAYGDVGSNTLGNVARAVGGMDLPNLAAAGLGNIAPLGGRCAARRRRLGAWGSMDPRSAGKDSTTGHWEIAGVHLAKPVSDVSRRVSRRRRRRIRAADGTRSDRQRRRQRHGRDRSASAPEQQRTGSVDLYTSADSVFQIAAHEGVYPLAELYRGVRGRARRCSSRRTMCRASSRGRSSASPGAYRANEESARLLDRAARRNAARCARTRGHSRGPALARSTICSPAGASPSTHTANNAEGIAAIARVARRAREWVTVRQPSRFRSGIRAPKRRSGVLWSVAAVRRRPSGAAGSLTRGRSALHHRRPRQRSDDAVDRPCARVRAAPRARSRGAARRPLGAGRTFSDLGATVAEWLGVEFRGRGTSFLPATGRPLG